MKIQRALYLATGIVLACAGIALAVGGGLSSPAQRSVGPPPDDLGAQTVQIAVPGAPNVSGWLVAGPPNGGAVLLLHGVRSDRRQMLGRMRLLSSAGFTVLAIDLPAHGESLGKRITFGANESKGVAAALGYLHRAKPCERVAVLGVSLGAASFVLSNPRSRVDAAVLESMFPTIKAAVEDRLAIRLGSAGRWAAPILLSQLKWRTGVGAEELRPIARVGEIHAPVLFLSGLADQHTTPKEAEAIFAAANAPKALWLVPGAGHVDLYAFAPWAYKAKILPFLKRYLQDSGRGVGSCSLPGPNNSSKPTPLRGAA